MVFKRSMLFFSFLSIRHDSRTVNSYYITINYVKILSKGVGILQNVAFLKHLTFGINSLNRIMLSIYDILIFFPIWRMQVFSAASQSSSRSIPFVTSHFRRHLFVRYFIKAVPLILLINVNKITSEETFFFYS